MKTEIKFRAALALICWALAWLVALQSANAATTNAVYIVTVTTNSTLIVSNRADRFELEIRAFDTSVTNATIFRRKALTVSATNGFPLAVVNGVSEILFFGEGSPYWGPIAGVLTNGSIAVRVSESWNQ